MKTSYKKKLRLVRDEQFNNPFYEKEKIKIMFQKGLLIAIAVSILIYLSKIF